MDCCISVTKFEFVAALCVLLDILQTIKIASDSLQTQDLALDNAFKLIDDAQDDLSKKRTDEHYNQLLQEERQLAQICSLVPQEFEIKRVQRRKLHHDEQARDEPQSAPDSFKMNVFTSSINTCLVQLKERFADNREVMTCFRVPTPQALLEGENNVTIPEDLKGLFEVYGKDEIVEISNPSQDQREENERPSEDTQTITLKVDIDPCEQECNIYLGELTSGDTKMTFLSMTPK